MTYNIRNGRGLDDRVDLARTARVIAAYRPDIVTLQEVDASRARSGGLDQATALAAHLDMIATFAPCIEHGSERYGIATLTRLPLVGETRRIALPHHGKRRYSEPRCALVTRVGWHDLEVDIVNTHLSILPGERPAQLAAVIACLATDDVIVAGDFNCTPKALARALRFASPRCRTWPSRLPLLPLDHILVRGLEVVASGTWTEGEARVASDHLPLVAELA